MSKETLRIEKICLNCNHIVEQRFCPNCGQENTITRKSFHHLFIHFFENLTHYDNTFWRSIYYLLFKPAALTKAYMSGKRSSFLSPVRLYIFISFITFLLIALFPNKNIEKKTIPKENKPNQVTVTVPSIDSLHIDQKSVDGLTKVGILSQKNNDTIKKMIQDTKDISSNEIIGLGYKNIQELDSIQKNGSEKVKVSQTEYWFLKKWLAVKEENTNEEIIEKFSESFTHNLPKVLFVYMPVFAFILWLFHDKKKRYYFDHGIFTLHYFSFLLLVILLLFFIDKFQPLLSEYPILAHIHFYIKTIGVFWMLYYFFPAHRRFYEDTFVHSFFKSSLVFVINLIVIGIIITLYALYTYINLH